MHDVLVVGLGAMGSSTLYHLAGRGCRVIGVDSWSPPHQMGSTHGRSRIIREAYYEHPSYVPLVRRAYENWSALEKLTGTVLFTRTGGLMIGAPGSALIRGTMDSSNLHGLSVEALTATQIETRFPAFHVDETMVGAFEENAGILFPEQCVRAYLDAASAVGAEIRTDMRVSNISIDGGVVSAITPAGEIRARRVVLAAGPWNTLLLEDLGIAAPLVVERQTMHWFEPSDRGRAPAASEFPVMLMEYEDDRYFYAMPDTGDGIKAAIHHEGQIVSPDLVDRVVTAADIEPAQALVRRFIPAAGDRVRRSCVCLYTDTPDRDFIIDTLAEMPSVVLLSACSGHGFKFASAIGEIAAALALDEPRTLDISQFRAGRFA